MLKKCVYLGWYIHKFRDCELMAYECRCKGNETYSEDAMYENCNEWTDDPLDIIDADNFEGE